MKKQLKTAAAALVLVVIASTSFAESVDLSSLADTTDGGIAATKALTATEMTLSITNATHLENVGLIAQSDSAALGNMAYIDQSGSSNFAAITQVGAGTSGNVAAIAQLGSFNRAVINQR